MTDQSWKRLKESHQRLKNGESISDDELMYAATHLQIATNADYAAYLIIGAIAPICGYRHHLTKQLVDRPMLPLLYSGIDMAEEVIAWLQGHLEADAPFDGMDERGIAWVRWLTTQPELIQKHLDQEDAKNDEGLLGDTRERFAPHSKIPLSAIVFSLLWRDKYLVYAPKIILYFTIPNRESDDISFTSFTLLTEVLAAHDPKHDLSLIVLNGHAYHDFIFHVNHLNLSFPDLDARNVHILWLFKGNVIRNVDQNMRADKQIYENYTLELMSND